MSDYNCGAILDFSVRVLRGIVGDRCPVLTSATRLDLDLELASIQLVEFLVSLEDEFDIELDPIVVLELNSLGEIAAHIAMLRGPGEHVVV